MCAAVRKQRILWEHCVQQLTTMTIPVLAAVQYLKGSVRSVRWKEKNTVCRLYSYIDNSVKDHSMLGMVWNVQWILMEMDTPTLHYRHAVRLQPMLSIVQRLIIWMYTVKCKLILTFLIVWCVLGFVSSNLLWGKHSLSMWNWRARTQWVLIHNKSAHSSSTFLNMWFPPAQAFKVVLVVKMNGVLSGPMQEMMKLLW